MNQPTRAEVAAGQHELRRDAKRERWLLAKGLLALAIVVVIAVVRTWLLP